MSAEERESDRPETPPAGAPGEESRRRSEREGEIPYRKADEESEYDERGEQGREGRAPLRED